VEFAVRREPGGPDKPRRGECGALTGDSGVQSHRVDAGLHQLSVSELHTAVPRIFAALDEPGAASERVSHPLGNAGGRLCEPDGKESAR
jgi:hypothetical protein